MRAIMLFAAALLAAGGAFASSGKQSPSKPKAKAQMQVPGKAQLPDPPKERTLKEMIDFVGINGESGVLHQKEQQLLGYANQLKTKLIAYVLNQKPIYHARAFKVLYDEKGKPLSLILTDQKIKTTGEENERSIEEWNFRSSVEGKLEQIAVVWGLQHEKKGKFIPANPAKRNEFARLKLFFLKEAVGMQPSN